MVVRRLILTAIEHTWPQDTKEPLIFLGEWCRRYSRKAVWQQLDAKVAPYHWDDRQKLFDDYEYTQELYEQLLSELSDKLNHIHSVNHSLRYWRILIGPWLGCFIQILFDRWFMLKQTIEKEKIIDCNIIERTPLSVVSNDMRHFIKQFVDDDWNEAVYGQLLKLCWGNVVNIQKIKKQSIHKKLENDSNVKLRIRPNFKNCIDKFCIPIFNKLFPKDDGYLFISSYFPLKTDFKLQIGLGQFPKLWQRPSAPITKTDIQQRQWRLGDHKFDNALFDDVARYFIPLHIPTIYLEGYKKLNTLTDQIAWPKKPNAIFTANAYNSNDVFKNWAGKKTEEGTMLVIGQHGGNYGMSRFSFLEKHQIDIADKWLSWGWSDKKIPKIIPFGNLKSFERKVRYDPDGNALMVEMSLPRYSYHLYALPLSKQLLEYQDDQQKFLKTLPYELRCQVLIRLSSQDYGWDQKYRWRDKVPEAQIDPGSQDIRKLVRKSRLYISTYNSTTYLESLSWNVPTIIFWNPKHWELKDEAKPYFELLKSAGIFHNTPESAAQQMINVWQNVDSWWSQSHVQKVRKKFCEIYSKRNQKPLKDFKKILLS